MKAKTTQTVILNNNKSNVVQADIGATPQDDPHYGFHIGWYYEMVAAEYQTYSWAVDWFNSWHYEFGWNVGWNLGWYADATAAGGYSYGWNVGWNVGWYAEFGWNYGWGLEASTSYYYTLGDLKLATDLDPYIGWGMTDLGVGIGLSMLPSPTADQHIVDYNAGYQVQQITLESAYAYQGWVYGWNNAGSGWSVGWSIGWAVGATFGLTTDVAEGYYFAGWPTEYYSPLDSWDYDSDLAYGLTWGWTGIYDWAFI